MIFLINYLDQHKSFRLQAGAKCDCALVAHAIALTVLDKLRTLFQFRKKIVICFDSCKFLLSTYLSQKKKKSLKLYPIHHVKPRSASTLLNILAAIAVEMFNKGKNLVINSVVYCKTAPAADPNMCTQMRITEQL